MAPFPEPTLVSRGGGIVSSTNQTIDDASAAISYNGFFPQACGTGNCVYDGTIHEATTAGATASFTFVGTDLFFYGIEGPDYGTFTVQIDGSSHIYQANTEYPAVQVQALLLGIHGLVQCSHTVVLTTREEGKTVALDSIMYTTSTGPATSGNGGQQGTAIIIGGAQASSTDYVQTYSTPIATVTTTDVFGQVATSVIYGPATTTIAGSQPPNTSNGQHTGAIIGGVIGVLLFLVIAHMILIKNNTKKADSDKPKKPDDEPPPAA